MKGSPTISRHVAIILLVSLAVTSLVGAQTPNQAPILFDASYGECAPGSTPHVGLWWASSGWKVSQDRPIPVRKGKAIEIRCARNETDAAQLVVSPSVPLSNFLASPAGPLTGPHDAAIPPQNVEVLRVRYVNIVRPTDRTSVAAPWPDPLPPFKGPVQLAANVNQPLWIRVFVPRDTPAGLYKDAIRLTADGYEATAPLRVTVYDFTLPDRLTCTTALGFGAGKVFQYQRITDPAQKREVLDKYWADFRAHHISPYDPAPLDPDKVEWVKLAPDQGADLPEADRKLLEENALTPKFDWAAWDAETDRVFKKYQFSTFRLGIPGMGNQLQGFTEGSRGYQLAFTAYCRTLQEHLRERGLLDKGFVYWTDEPSKADYPFVMNGFRKLKEAAPDLLRMITEQVVPELVGGPNIWCPDSWWYEHDKAEERRRQGDIFWWYICTVPKAPFPGEFIDHPGTDLRVWLWQTWKYNIKGILVWHSNLWSSGYPSGLQNPYEDPESWQAFQKPWGNGDGRFVYPPEAAATGQQSETILDGPVDSIRWEMLRDGLEDYEYMVILKRLIEEKKGPLPARQLKRIEELLQVPDEITADLKTYTKDPAPIEKRRDAVARAIERLATP